jgi:hypothetical protein
LLRAHQGRLEERALPRGSLENTTMKKTMMFAMALSLLAAPAFAKGKAKGHCVMKDGSDASGKTKKECKAAGGTWAKNSAKPGASSSGSTTSGSTEPTTTPPSK